MAGVVMADWAWAEGHGQLDITHVGRTVLGRESRDLRQVGGGQEAHPTGDEMR